MFDQNTLNLIFSGFGFLVSIIVSFVWWYLRDAHRKSDENAEKINGVSEKINDKFVSKDQYNNTIKELRLDLTETRRSIENGLASVQSLLTQILMQKKD